MRLYTLSHRSKGQIQAWNPKSLLTEPMVLAITCGCMLDKYHCNLVQNLKALLLSYIITKPVDYNF